MSLGTKSERNPFGAVLRRVATPASGTRAVSLQDRVYACDDVTASPKSRCSTADAGPTVYSLRGKTAIKRVGWVASFLNVTFFTSSLSLKAVVLKGSVVFKNQDMFATNIDYIFFQKLKIMFGNTKLDYYNYNFRGNYWN